jgi:hypothetical protein
MIRKIFQNLTAHQREERRTELYRNLIRHEARLGGELFGPIPAGGRREFFCLDRRTWIWHEEWLDKNGQRQIRTTRYDVRPDGILKAQDGQSYKQVNLEEALRLAETARLYQERIHNELYSQI